MSIVDGGVLFSDKAGFYGVTKRLMWEFRAHLWYLVASESTGNVPGTHLKRMHELLCRHIGSDHEEFQLRFKESIDQTSY